MIRANELVRILNRKFGAGTASLSELLRLADDGSLASEQRNGRTYVDERAAIALFSVE